MTPFKRQLPIIKESVLPYTYYLPQTVYPELFAPISENSNIQSSIAQTGIANHNYQGGLSQRRLNNNLQSQIAQRGYSNCNAQMDVMQNGIRRGNFNSQSGVAQKGNINSNYQGEISQGQNMGAGLSGSFEAAIDGFDVIRSPLSAGLLLNNIEPIKKGTSFVYNANGHLNLGLKHKKTNENRQENVAQSGWLNSNAQDKVSQSLNENYGLPYYTNTEIGNEFLINRPYISTAPASIYPYTYDMYNLLGQPCKPLSTSYAGNKLCVDKFY